jgi:hypothetical protein
MSSPLKRAAFFLASALARIDPPLLGRNDPPAASGALI